MTSEFRIGDVGTALELTIEDQDGDVVDLTSATVKSIKFTKPDETTVTKTAQFVTDGTDGKIRYVFTIGDLDLDGTWKYQAILTLTSGLWHSDIGKFVVKHNL
jgi:hypothetical protein